MSFDYDRAWRDTTRLARENRPLLAGIAGIFFFVPYAALLLTLPLLAPMPPSGADFATIAKSMQAIYASAWWAFALVMICLVYGTLAMLALMKLRARPTVGEALRIGAAALPAYLLAVVIEMLGIELIVGTIAVIVATSGNSGLLVAGWIISFALQLYLVVRFAMTAPVMVLEGERNPVKALRRSWDMTQGRGWKISGFIVLLLIAFLVVTMLLSLVFGLLLALVGEAGAQFGDALFSAAVLSASFTLMACVLAAVYSQISRASRPAQD